MGNARGGALGDCIASVLEKAGYDVTREFYINDAGNQIEKFGISLEARYIQLLKGEDAVEFPEDGYHGEDIIDHMKAYIEENGDNLLYVDSEERRKTLVEYALPKNIERIRKSWKTTAWSLMSGFLSSPCMTTAKSGDIGYSQRKGIYL